MTGKQSQTDGKGSQNQSPRQVQKTIKTERDIRYTLSPENWT